MSAAKRRAGRASPAPDRLLSIEESTVARAGEAATRLALEDTLVRKGWRVLFFDEQFGPMLGPLRTKLFDGIAVRMRPGEEESLDLRLLHVESGTLEIPEGTIERLRRVALSASLEWLLAAFDGETMRLVPDPDLAEGAPRRAEPSVLPAVAAAAGSRPGAPSAARGRAGRRGAPAAPPRGRRPRGAALPPPPEPLATAPAPVTVAGLAAPAAERAASEAAGLEPAAPEASRKPRRRGKRGGRRRSGRSGT